MFEYRGRQLDLGEGFEEYFEEKIGVKFTENDIDVYLDCVYGSDACLNKLDELSNEDIVKCVKKCLKREIRTLHGDEGIDNQKLLKY